MYKYSYLLTVMIQTWHDQANAKNFKNIKIILIKVDKFK